MQLPDLGLFLVQGSPAILPESSAVALRFRLILATETRGNHSLLNSDCAFDNRVTCLVIHHTNHDSSCCVMGCT